MQLQSAHPWMFHLLVYFRLPSSPLRPFLHWSDGPRAGPSLLLWWLGASSVDPVQLYSCGHLSFVPVHLTCGVVSTSLTHSVHLVHLVRRTARSCTDVLCHLRTCVMYWHSARKHMTWRADTTLRMFQGHQNDMKLTTLTWGRARRCRRRTCFSCRELMLERIVMRSSCNSLTLKTHSCSHARASVTSRIRYYIPAEVGSRVLRGGSKQYVRWSARRCTLVASAVQSDEMLDSVGYLHFRQQ